MPPPAEPVAGGAVPARKCGMQQERALQEVLSWVAPHLEQRALPSLAAFNRERQRHGPQAVINLLVDADVPLQDAKKIAAAIEALDATAIACKDTSDPPSSISVARVASIDDGGGGMEMVADVPCVLDGHSEQVPAECDYLDGDRPRYDDDFGGNHMPGKHQRKKKKRIAAHSRKATFTSLNESEPTAEHVDIDTSSRIEDSTSSRRLCCSLCACGLLVATLTLGAGVTALGSTSTAPAPPVGLPPPPGLSVSEVWSAFAYPPPLPFVDGRGSHQLDAAADFHPSPPPPPHPPSHRRPRHRHPLHHPFLHLHPHPHRDRRRPTCCHARRRHLQLRRHHSSQ